ncbi:MAG: TonB family protein [Candidatus Eremiobacteraeota bacterium]|nr:TonB family protein [Candidatus Eremiobacteraeota bacterium]
MKVWLISAACAITLGVFAFAPARADNGCAAALKVFHDADDAFTQADTAKDKAAWERGNAIVAGHHDDIAPAGCDIDEFELTRLVALEHGLRTGLSLGTVDGAEAVRAGDKAYDVTLYNAQARRMYMNVRADLQKRFGSLLLRAHDYLWDTARTYRDTVPLSRSDGSCAAPYMDATALVPVTPEFPTNARYIGKVATTLVRVRLSANGEVDDASIQQSSGNTAIDDAAMQAARATLYFPKIMNCHRLPGTYLFRATFSPG